jgi:peptidoglycan/LPS O-acetylase OafA/YrhL
MLVVASHAGLHKIPGDAGVTVFFAVSGFIITLLVLRERERTGAFDLKAFYVRRLLKLGPPLLLIVVVPSIIYAALADLSIAQLLSQMFFVFNWVEISVGEGNLQVLPGSSVVWSLSVEEQFYIVFALFWAVVCRWSHWVPALTVLAGATVVASTASRVLLWQAGASNERLYRGTDVRMDAIALGVLTAYYFWYCKSKCAGCARTLASDWVLASSICAFVLSFAIRDEWFQAVVRPSVHAAVACLIILWGLLEGRDSWFRRFIIRAGKAPLAAAIGLASYSIYLIHLILIHAYMSFHLELPFYVEFACLMVLSTAAGIAVYITVELPVSQYKERLQRARTRDAGAGKV